MIHGIFDHTFQRYIDCGCIEYFEEQKEKGRIKHLGFSSHANVENFTTFVNLRKWDFCMIPLNPYDWVYGTAKQQYGILLEQKIPIISMGPVRGGTLSALSPRAEAILKETHPNWSISEWAVRWGKNFEGVMVVLSGMSTMEQIKDNVAVFGHDEGLSESDEALFFDACETYRNEVRVACTHCKYCIESDTCHAKINIPPILDIYNASKIDNPWALGAIHDVDSEGSPADCTSCGKCSSRCPQNIKIEDVMEELAEAMKRIPPRRS